MRVLLRNKNREVVFKWNNNCETFSVIEKYKISRNQIDILILQRAHEGIEIKGWETIISLDE
jgi:hypothetical protein